MINAKIRIDLDQDDIATILRDWAHDELGSCDKVDFQVTPATNYLDQPTGAYIVKAVLTRDAAVPTKTDDQPA